VGATSGGLTLNQLGDPNNGYRDARILQFAGRFDL
jgi:hypothetical protein